MVQQDIVGDYGGVQAVFDHGEVLVHSSVKVSSGAGGSAA